MYYHESASPFSFASHHRSIGVDAAASSLRTTRRVLYRDPYDLSLDVFTTRQVTRDESTGSVVSVDVDGQVLGGIRNREALASEVASVSYDETDGTVNTIVPEANADHFFTGMVVDHRCHMYVDIHIAIHRIARILTPSLL